jgi:hypothetical protein
MFVALFEAEFERLDNKSTQKPKCLESKLGFGLE